MRCEVGDIVCVNNFTYPNGSDGSYHNFVIVAIDEDELTLAHLDYFGFLVSSQINKNSDVNKNFPYNEPIDPGEVSGLQKKSHVKCDELFNVKPDNVFMKLGMVTDEQYNKFMELYHKSLSED